jgi:hypothetical protein
MRSVEPSVLLVSEVQILKLLLDEVRIVEDYGHRENTFSPHQLHLAMGAKDTIRGLALLGFLVFTILPTASSVLWLLNSPNATTADVLSLIESAAIPWWTGLAQAAPLLFVIVAGILIWAGAEEVLE